MTRAFKLTCWTASTLFALYLNVVVGMPPMLAIAHSRTVATREPSLFHVSAVPASVNYRKEGNDNG